MRSVVILILVVACGAKSALEVDPRSDPDAGRDASRRDATRDGARDAPLDVSPRDAPVDVLRRDVGFEDVMPPDTSFDADLCAPFVARVGPATLELRFVVDRSFSMANETVTGQTKSEELADGLGRFFALSEAAGTHVSLTFFPGAPIPCSSDGDCLIGRCLMPDVCDDGDGRLCDDDGDCPDRVACIPLGRCDLGPLNIVTCMPPPPGGDAGTPPCPSDLECIDFGYCENGPPYRMTGPVSLCTPSNYQSPTVPSLPLPGVAGPLNDALATIRPAGGTPTVPALIGVHAAARTSASRTHRKVVVILATDTRHLGCLERGGLPTMRRTAEEGLANGVPTFLLAILEADEDPTVAEDLASVAAAGGTELGLFTTAEVVSDALLDYVRELRAEESACTYELPTGARAGLEAWVVDGGTRTAIPQVANDDECGGHGFHFGRPLEDGVSVGWIELCDATCALMTPTADLEVRNRCEP